MLTMLAISGAAAQEDGLRAGVAAASEHDWHTAHTAFERVAGNSTDASLRTPARLAAAESLFQQGHFDEALNRFAVLHETMNEGTRTANALVVLRYAQCLAHGEQWAAAASVAETALQSQSGAEQRAALTYVLGRCHTALGEHAQARKQYFQVARMSEVDEQLRLQNLWMIAYTYAAEGELATARDTYLRIEQAAQATPRVAAGALVEAGRCSERRGQWQVAEAMYKQAVEKYAADGISTEASRRLAVVQIRQGQTQRR